MKKNILTTIVYHYYLAKAQCCSIKPLFINKFNNRSNIIWMGSIKSIRCCYTDAYYETYILPLQLEAHDKMQEEYLSQAPH
ncbi:Uncharacterised protein [Enterobacter hormaechei]|uniref:hypothetical protein n=1 Tax=Enterobacter TaxID=547 RepID=UPI0005ED523D|nr:MULTISPECIES: hypothetical protein [Enterobacter cloacae complex]ELQ6006317.1 hypothetical protein [Cronobacter sakazakii]MBK4299622.1 hypothetical protein [Enterobacter cloacae]HAY4303581.1 hypothetical protein [Escherichia coli]KJN40195.1 hypothetical protein SS45_20095 [Enterobacter hormaechei subsp. steigerwaltii]KRS23679.1 hypothetical protein Ent8706_10525 [Enterobacter kobei]